MAPVAPSGFGGASKETNHVSPRASRAVNPAATPLLFSRTTVQVAGSGAGWLFGPVTSSSAESGAGADAIGEPARVGHLVDRVDVAARGRPRARAWT